MKRIDLQPAYILHTRPYRDTSLLVDLLTLDYGLLRAVARGARGRASGKRAVMQAFQPLLVSLAGRGELLSLNQAEQAAPSFRLTGDRLFSGMYLNELLSRLLQAQEAHPQIYRLYQQALVSLQQQGSLERCLRCFEFNLLLELGYGWDLRCDVLSGTELRVGACYLFDPEHGYEEVQAPVGHWPPALFLGEDLLEFAAVVSSSDVDEVSVTDDVEGALGLQSSSRYSAKRLMRQALRPHLGAKPLLSRTLFAAKSTPDRSPDHDSVSRILPPRDNKG